MPYYCIAKTNKAIGTTILTQLLPHIRIFDSYITSDLIDRGIDRLTSANPSLGNVDTTHQHLQLIIQLTSNILVTMGFTIQPCTPADAPGLALTMTTARLTDPHWVAGWKDLNPEEIIGKCIERVPQSPISGRATKRRQNAIDAETGQVVGYARRILPDFLAEEGDVWVDAQVGEPTPAARELYQRKSDESTDNGRIIGRKQEMGDFISRPLEEADVRVTSHGGPFLSMLSIFSVSC